jgi:succinate dehydrogenase / fumarate reductase cytochrome b subunit
MLKNLQSNFLLRRLHSLSGIVPIGGFLVFHLLANATAIDHPENYNVLINFLRQLPFVEYIEWLVLYIPIGFHALYGVLIYTTAKPNHMQYSGLENYRYILQRITGFVALAYIAYHIWQFKIVENLDYNYIARAMAGNQSIPGVPAIPLINPFSVYWFYIIGLTSITYHFANGLWGFCITWGITVGKKSQQLVTQIGLVVFLVLTYVGVATINHLADAGKAMIAAEAKVEAAE